MIKINKKVEYALIALKYIAQRPQGSLTSAREICNSFHTPFVTTSKVLQVMNNNGILTSVKGIKGGYSLNKPLSSVTYTELVQIIEGRPLAENFCQSAKGVCDLYETCNIIEPLEQLNGLVTQYLQTLTLDQLLIQNTLRQDLARPITSNAEENSL